MGYFTSGASLPDSRILFIKIVCLSDIKVFNPMEHAGTDHQHLIDIISNILLFFAISGLIVPLLQRIRISPVLGYLISGIIIGPFGIAQFSDMHGWIAYISIDEAGTVQMLGELGIITLMFMIGLELSFDRLKELGRLIFGLGSAQILITALIIVGIATFFDNPLQASVLLGASFALSSTAIVMKLLEERKLSSRPIGILCFSILLMQDLAVVPILVLASSFTGDADASILTALGTSLLLGAVTVVGIYWLGKKVLTPLLRSISSATTSEWLAAFIVFLVLACSALTYAAELSLSLGAFLAGLLIAETEFKHEVEVIISPIKGLLLGVFFLSIGMMIDLSEIMRYPGQLSLSVIGIYALKASVILGLCLLFRVPGRQAAEASVYLAQPGEFALMILGVAMSAQLMPASDVQFFLLVTVVAMMVSPLLFKFAPIAGQYGHRFLGKREAAPSASAITGGKKVVIAGFGRIGQLIATVLEEHHIPYVAFDHDGERIQRLKNQGFHVIYGDARKKDLWHHLIGENIEVAVIAIDDHQATKPILKSLRTQFPLLPVIVRSKNHEDLNMLYDEGATEVVAETLESSLRIAQLLMQNLGNDPEEARRMIKKIRAQLC